MANSAVAPRERRWRRAMDILVPVLVVVGYFVLMRYVLPRFGVST